MYKIGNAVKYRKKDTVPIIEVSAAKVTPGFYQIKIRDNGIGFEQKQALEIFKPFKRLHGQREFAGTGLGLSLCENIVKRYGGEINAVSSPGEGALFTIQLPSIF